MIGCSEDCRLPGWSACRCNESNDPCSSARCCRRPCACRRRDTRSRRAGASPRLNRSPPGLSSSTAPTSSCRPMSRPTACWRTWSTSAASACWRSTSRRRRPARASGWRRPGRSTTSVGSSRPIRGFRTCHSIGWRHRCSARRGRAWASCRCWWPRPHASSPAADRAAHRCGRSRSTRTRMSVRGPVSAASAAATCTATCPPRPGKAAGTSCSHPSTRRSGWRAASPKGTGSSSTCRRASTPAAGWR